MVEAKAEIEVDFESCCSNYSNRLLCLRLYHVGNFQVRILPQAFIRNDVACLLLALALGQAPSI